MGQGAPEIAVPHAGETLWRALYARLVGEVVPLADLLSTHFGDDVVVGEAAAPAAMRILLMERSARREADERAAEVPGLRLRLAQAEDSATQAEAAWKAEHALRLAAEKAREAWTETARMHAKNEAYYRDLIVRTLSGTPAAFVSDDGSVQQDVICAKLPELYAASEKAREEADAYAGRANARIADLGERLDATEAVLRDAEKARKEAERERDRYRASAELRVGMRREFEALLGVGDTMDTGTFEAGLARLRALIAAESRAARLAKALASFADPERYNTAEEECRENKAMRWCAVHSFRWPCPVGPARAAIAAEEEK